MKTNIEIPVADLKTVLPGLSKIISKRATLPVLSCVKLTLNVDRTLHIQANNLDQIVTARLNKPFNGKPGAILVPLEELSSMAKRCAASDTIELSVDGDETAIIYPAAGTRIRKPISHISLDEMPPETVVNAEPVKLDDAFKEALQQALDCTAGENSGRHIIQGACLDVSNKEAHYVVGTDGRHIYSANSFLFDVPASINIPPTKFLTWAGFIEDGAWELRFQPGIEPDPKTKQGGKPAWVRLDSEHWTYVSRPVEGTYPNWKQVVPLKESLKSQIMLDEPGIKLILEALPLLPCQDEINQGITLQIKGDGFSIKAQGQNDWTEIPIPAKVSGPPVTIALNRKYLAKALKFGLGQIDIQDHLSPLVFSAKGKMIVVSPLRPPEVKPAPAAVTPPPAASPEKAPAAAAPPLAETSATAEPANTVTENIGTAAAHRPVQNAPSQSGAETPAIDLMLAQIGTVRDGAKKLQEDAGHLERLWRRAVKEQRANEKEINRARTTLRSLQSVEL